jgi:hypothetical protein
MDRADLSVEAERFGAGRPDLGSANPTKRRIDAAQVVRILSAEVSDRRVGLVVRHICQGTATTTNLPAWYSQKSALFSRIYRIRPRGEYAFWPAVSSTLWSSCVFRIYLLE